jgi:hypothetical protein
MNRVSKISFIIVFLGIIYAVPVVQTIYEFKTNPGRRIQMLDLPADLFITPIEKKKNDAVSLDTIAQSIEVIGHHCAAKPADTGSVWDLQRAIELCEAAAIRITVLKTGVIDYNRHVSGAANSFASRDTLKPYYRGLSRMGEGFEELSSLLQNIPVDSAMCAELAARLLTEVQKLRSMRTDDTYLTLTLTALRRIMVGANYLRPYELEMEKSSLFTTTIRPWVLLGYLRIFGDLGSKGITGTHDWLFYRPDVEYLVRPDVFSPRSKIVDANDAAITDDIIGSILDFKNQLAARGIDLLLVAMPGKPSIYPDLCNSRVSPTLSGKLSHTRVVLDRLQQAGVETVDLFSALAHERERDASCRDSLYLSTDTHFKGRGVLTAARTIAQRVRQYPWYKQGCTEFVADTVTVPRFGDIAEMIGVPATVAVKHKPPFAPESTKCYQVSRVERNEQGAVTRKMPYKDDYRNSKILVLGDSYSRIFQTDPPKSAGWISHLARELSQPVASLVNDGGASTLVRQTLARKANLLKNKKLVIWEVVERDFRFGEEGWKKVAIARKQ